MKRVSFLEETAKEMGREEERREMVLQMLADGESIAKICKYTKLTEKQIRELELKRAA